MTFPSLSQELTGASREHSIVRADYIVVLSFLAVLLRLWQAWPRRAATPILSHNKGWSAPWKDAIRYLKDSPGVLKEGYTKVRVTISKKFSSKRRKEDLVTVHVVSTQNMVNSFKCQRPPDGSLLRLRSILMR